MKLSWKIVHEAWVAVVREALGGSDDLSIVWAHKRNPLSVAPPSVVLKIEDFEGVDVGEAREFYNAAAAFNEEIERDTTRFFLCTLSIDIRCSTKDGTGDDSPHALAAHLLTVLRQESVQEELYAAGVGLESDGKGICPAEEINGIWQPTAKFPVRFYAAITATEKLGFIATYEGTTQATPPTPPPAAVPFSFTPEAAIAAEEP